MPQRFYEKFSNFLPKLMKLYFSYLVIKVQEAFPNHTLFHIDRDNDDDDMGR